MDGVRARAGRGRLPGEIAARREVEAAAHAALIPGFAWEALFDGDPDEVRALVRAAVMQRAVELNELRDSNLAVRFANAQNGGRTVNTSRSGGVSTR